MHALHHGYGGEVNMSGGNGNGGGNGRGGSGRGGSNENMYVNIRRPDVLMHGGTHHSLIDQDLLNLHNNVSLPLDDSHVSPR